VKHRTRWTTIAVTVVVLVLGAVLVAAVMGDGAPAHADMLGKSTPAISLTDLRTGKPITDDALANKTVVVNFWNDWCIPCRQETPALRDFYELHRNEADFVMIGIVRDPHGWGKIREYMGDEQIGWTVARDEGSSAALAFGTTGQPETFVIGPDGIIHAQLFGPARVADLQAMVDRARGIG
jgi:cytochrome c biogenesis protein CcmG/thiol:disulfide interchange protein DsbE